MADHVITVEFDAGHASGDFGALACFAPPEALCHAVWDCTCEEWDDPHIADGLPVHSSYNYHTDEEDYHVGRFDPEFCNLREWFDNSEENLSGPVSFPVTAEWNGYGYEFHPAQG